MLRETPNRLIERERDCQSRARERADPIRRRLEFDAENHRRSEMGWDKLIEQFQRDIRKAPIHPCTSCGCIYYLDNIKTIDQHEIPNEVFEHVMCVHTNNPQFCGTYIF